MPSTADIAVRLFGTVRITYSGSDVDPRVVGGPRCAELLAYLALNRHREVSHDELATIQWPQRRPRSWYSSLRGTISKARDALEAANISGDVIRSRGGKVRLLLPADAVVDIEVVRRFCRSAELGPDVAVNNVRFALDALAGPVMVGVSGSWADDLRAECEELRLRALAIDAAVSLKNDDYDAAVSSAESLLAVDPLRESAYRIAMTAYAALGDRAQALHLAARCRRALAAELGASPSVETETLYLSLLREDEGRQLAADTPAQRRPEPYPPLVGRGAELAVIADALAAAARGVGQFVVISGEAGVGKTALASEAMRSGRARQAEVLLGRCTEGGVIPYEPLVEAATRELDARGIVESRQWLARNGTDILRIVPNAARRYGAPVPVTAGHADDQALIMTAALEWLTGPARTAPVMLVIDDLQWASAPTLHVLRYLVHASVSARVCIVVTIRDEFRAGPELASMLYEAARTTGVHRIRLGGLSPAEVAEMMRRSGVDIDPVALHERTGGSPFFVAALLGSGGQSSAETMPSSITDAIGYTVQRLSDDARVLLQLCSVIGMALSRSVLRASTTIDDDMRFAQAHDELLQNRLITESDVDGLRIRHPLVQDAVYADISGAERASMHSAVGVALERAGAAHSADGLAGLAHHFSKALDKHRPAAAHYARRAGDSAFAIGASEDAVTHYRSALEKMVPQQDSPQRCRVLIDLAIAQRRSLDRGYRDTLLRAGAMARRINDVDCQVAAALADAMDGMILVQIFGPGRERLGHFYDALEALELSGRGSSGAAAEVLAQIAIELTWSPDHMARRRLLERALAAARSSGDRQALHAVLLAILRALRTPEHHAWRAAALTELVGFMDMSPGGGGDPPMIILIARHQIELGDLTAAEHTLGSLTPAHISRDGELKWMVNCTRCGIASAAGRMEEASTWFDTLRAPPDSPIDSFSYGRDLATLLALRTLCGDLDELVIRADEMAQFFDRLPSHRVGVALAFLDSGRVAEAERLISWFDAARISAIAKDMLWLPTMAMLARAAAQAADTVVCRLVYDQLVDFADQTVILTMSVFGVVHHHLAHMAIAMGQFTRAAEHVADATREHARRGYVGWRVETDYLGLRLEAARSGRLSRAGIDSVRDEADAIGATAVVRRIDALQAVIIERAVIIGEV